MICQQLKPLSSHLACACTYCKFLEDFCNKSKRISSQTTRLWVLSVHLLLLQRRRKNNCRALQGGLLSILFNVRLLLLWYATRLATDSARLHIFGVTCIGVDRKATRNENANKSIKAHAAGKAKCVTRRLVEHTHVHSIESISCSTRECCSTFQYIQCKLWLQISSGGSQCSSHMWCVSSSATAHRCCVTGVWVNCCTWGTLS